MLTSHQIQPRVEAAPTPAKGKPRLTYIDFAKGSLVLLMVYYHWLNYFVGLDSPIYSYIRFLTPSFIFLAGFVISIVYLPRLQAGERGIPGRLIHRGWKLLALVLGLNIVAQALGVGISASRWSAHTQAQVVWAFFSGSFPVAFSVLVPISYLLFLSAGLLRAGRYTLKLIPLAAIALVGLTILLERQGMSNAYLELLGAGMLGLWFGRMRSDSWTFGLPTALVLLIVYPLYIWAIDAWNVLYVLQLVGVCLNLGLLFWLGKTQFGMSRAGALILRLGEYSLFAYIAQLVILQVLRKAPFLTGPGGYGTLLAATLATILSVLATHWLRQRADAFNRAYSIVFP